MENLTFYIFVIVVLAFLVALGSMMTANKDSQIVEQQNAIMSMNDMLSQVVDSNMNYDEETEEDNDVVEGFQRGRRTRKDNDSSSRYRRGRPWRRGRRWKNWPVRRWSRPITLNGIWPQYYPYSNDYYNRCRNYAQRQCANSQWPQYCIPGAYQDCKLALTGST